MFINVSGISCSSAASGQSSSDESPGEGLDERWQSFELPHSLKNLVGLELYASYLVVGSCT
jgi:hypothetical protein